jgi:hypothetical protein
MSFDFRLSHLCTSVSTSSSSARCVPLFLTSCELLYTTNISLWITFALSSFANKKRTKERCFSHGRHFDYSNLPLNVHMCVCYLDCNEAGLCCYLVIHIENLLYPLQVFYFHLWPICWLSLLYDLKLSWWQYTVKSFCVISQVSLELCVQCFRDFLCLHHKGLIWWLLCI